MDVLLQIRLVILLSFVLLFVPTTLIHITMRLVISVFKIVLEPLIKMIKLIFAMQAVPINSTQIRQLIAVWLTVQLATIENHHLELVCFKMLDAVLLNLLIS